MGRVDYMEAMRTDRGLVGADVSGNDPEFMDNSGLAPNQTEVRFARKRWEMLLHAVDDPELTDRINAGDLDEEIMDMITRGEQ